MKVIGITGRSGCGKSTVTRCIAQHGYPCCDADEISREILLPGSACLSRLRQAFGQDILAEDGSLRRRLLADRAFATPQGTAALTGITWPEIMRRIEAQRQAAQKAGDDLFFVDGAVIVSTPFEAKCDKLVVVLAPYKTSVERICLRDGIAPEMARRRLDAQTAEETLRSAADYILENNGTEQELLTKTEVLLRQLEKEDNGAEQKDAPRPPA